MRGERTRPLVAIVSKRRWEMHTVAGPAGWRSREPNNAAAGEESLKGLDTMDDSKKDRFEGNMDEGKGKIKEAYGQMTGDRDTEAEGQADQAEGQVKQGMADVKDKMNDLKDKVTGN